MRLPLSIYLTPSNYWNILVPGPPPQSDIVGNHRNYRGSAPDSPRSSSHSRSQSRSHSQSPRSRSPRSRSPCSARSRSPGSPQSQASKISEQSRVSRMTGKTSRSRSQSPDDLARLPHNCISPPIYPRNFPFQVEPQRSFPDARYPHWVVQYGVFYDNNADIIHFWLWYEFTLVKKRVQK